MAADSPAPSWYPNPDGTPSWRWWDGTGWTRAVRTTGGPVPGSPALPDRPHAGSTPPRDDGTPHRPPGPVPATSTGPQRAAGLEGAAARGASPGAAPGSLRPNRVPKQARERSETRVVVVGVAVLAAIFLGVVAGVRWWQGTRPQAVAATDDMTLEEAQQALREAQEQLAEGADAAARRDAAAEPAAEAQSADAARRSEEAQQVFTLRAEAAADLAACAYVLDHLEGGARVLGVSPDEIQTALAKATPGSPVARALRVLLTEASNPDTSPAAMERFHRAIEDVDTACANAPEPPS